MICAEHPAIAEIDAAHVDAIADVEDLPDISEAEIIDHGGGDIPRAIAGDVDDGGGGADSENGGEEGESGGGHVRDHSTDSGEVKAEGGNVAGL